MRRFLRSFTVTRHAQYAVLQDGDTKTITVIRWAADNWKMPQHVEEFRYAGDPEDARVQAIAMADRRSKTDSATVREGTRLGFIKSLTVARHIQYTVLQDVTAKRFIILKWAAETWESPEEIMDFPYTQNSQPARDLAIKEVERLFDAETKGREAVLGVGR